MQKLDIYKPYIDGFVDENKVCLYEGYGGFWTEQETELQEKIDQIEKTHNCTVYAVTHEFTEFGELYSMLIVPLSWASKQFGITNDTILWYAMACDDYTFCQEYSLEDENTQKYIEERFVYMMIPMMTKIAVKIFFFFVITKIAPYKIQINCTQNSNRMI